MNKVRLIAVILIRDGGVVQSINFKHTNVIHYDAVHAVDAFNRWSVDEIVFLNVDREPSGRDQFLDIVNHVSRKCFVPLSVGGWVTDYDYASKLLSVGADKLVVNTVINDQPNLVRDLSGAFGSQCIIGSVDIKNMNGRFNVVVDRGRRAITNDIVGYCKGAVDLGVGEILLNSVDHDGARKGYVIREIARVSTEVSVPLIAVGGVFKWQHLVEGIHNGADAVAAANIFHYVEHATRKAKKHMKKEGINVRLEEF